MFLSSRLTSKRVRIQFAVALAAWPVFGGVALGVRPVCAETAQSATWHLEVGHKVKGQWQSLKTLQESDVKSFGALKSLNEAWPGTQRKSSWQGYLIADVIQKALDQMTVEERAQIDLVILQTGEGDGAQRALLPRALLKNFPFLLATHRDGKNSAKGWVSVPPLASRSKLQSEGLPIESYFLESVSRIELANSKERYRAAILLRRTDPIAVRGERVFVSSCLACHDSGRAPRFEGSGEVISAAASQASTPASAISTVASHFSSTLSPTKFKPLHKTVPGTPSLNDRDWQSLKSYWDAVKVQPPEGSVMPAGGVPIEAGREGKSDQGAEAAGGVAQHSNAG